VSHALKHAKATKVAVFVRRVRLVNMMAPTVGDGGLPQVSNPASEMQLDLGQGQVYKGQVAPGSGSNEGDGGQLVPHGEGTLHWPNGDYYQGGFYLGSIQGKGRKIMAQNGGNNRSPCRKYRVLWTSGNFVDGKLQGPGIQVFGDIGSHEAKQWYQGEFREGRMEGRGTYVDKVAGIVTSGDFLNNMVHGYAVRKFANGDELSGEFIRGATSGRCSYRFANGAVYEGEFTPGGANGFGVKQAAGMRYIGEFKDDKFNGRGVLKFSSGDVYKGEFKDDALHGKGIYQFANDDWCSGNFVQDRMSGHGEFFFSNGDKYVGEFQEDEIHGSGVYKFAKNNEVYEGKFESGKLQPYGRKTFSDGTTLEGTFKDGKPCGECNFTYISGPKAGETVKVVYKDGVLVEEGEVVEPSIPRTVSGSIPS